jgi:hypothetical protein
VGDRSFAYRGWAAVTAMSKVVLSTPHARSMNVCLQPAGISMSFSERDTIGFSQLRGRGDGQLVGKYVR